MTREVILRSGVEAVPAVSGRTRCRNVTIFRGCLWSIIEIYCSSNIFASNRRLLQGETAITVEQKRGGGDGSGRSAVIGRVSCVHFAQDKFIFFQSLQTHQRT